MLTVVNLNIQLTKQTANVQQNASTARNTTPLIRGNARSGILKKKYWKLSIPGTYISQMQRKVLKVYTAAPDESSASITKTAGVTVSCVDAAIQTDPVLIRAAPQSSSYKAASTEAPAS